MVACHNFYIIYGAWRSQKVEAGREVSQSSYLEGKPQRRRK